MGFLSAIFNRKKSVQQGLLQSLIPSPTVGIMVTTLSIMTAIGAQRVFFQKRADVNALTSKEIRTEDPSEDAMAPHDINAEDSSQLKKPNMPNGPNRVVNNAQTPKNTISENSGVTRNELTDYESADGAAGKLKLQLSVISEIDASFERLRSIDAQLRQCREEKEQILQSGELVDSSTVSKPSSEGLRALPYSQLLSLRSDSLENEQRNIDRLKECNTQLTKISEDRERKRFLANEARKKMNPPLYDDKRAVIGAASAHPAAYSERSPSSQQRASSGER